MALDYVVFDLETTGLSPGVDEIIEIGAVKLLDGKVAGRFQSLVRCGREVPAPVQRLTGITTTDLAGQPSLAEVLPRFLEFADCLPLAAHNAAFDIGFLNTALSGARRSPQYLDTFELARLCFPLAPNYRLSGLAQFLGLDGEGFHRALNDAEVTAQLLLRCHEKMKTWDLGLVRQLNLLLGMNPGGLASLLQEREKELARAFPNRLIGPGALYLASQQSETGLFAKQGQKQKPRLEEPARISGILAPEGPMAEKVSNYQYRPGQLKMLQGVLKAFETETHLVVEAGTGTGKSLAYLVPAVCWAASRGEKVAIATHTINLQEQLWQKDIPLLRSLLPFGFEAALVKGRSNYLCLRKWQGIWSGLEHLNQEERLEAALILTWLSETASGDRTELNPRGKGLELWARFSADSESCLGSRCRFFADSCFVMRARRKAENADVLILNHSLLLSDIKTDNKVLPSYNYLVIDEAHHLEDSATEQLGASISAGRLEQLHRMLRPGGSPPGLLGQLRHRLPGLAGQLPEDSLERLAELLDKAVETLALLRESAQEFFDLLASLAYRNSGQEAGSVQLRLRPQMQEAPDWSALAVCGGNLTMRLTALAEGLEDASQVLEDPESEELAALIRDMKSMAAQCRELGFAATGLLNLETDNQVVWVEADEKSCSLCSAPVEVGPLLRAQMFSRLKAGILTSATLSVNNSFGHFMERVGLDPDTAWLQVESPFRYEEQALLCIPRDLPDPAKTLEEDYTHAVGMLLVDLIRTVQGRTLVLFTSHRMLRDTYSLAKPYLEAEDIQLLGHSLDGSRGKLVEEFKTNPRTALFGASSFWEGVDIQGETLSCVVIVKLPFWPPTIPTIEARMEELIRQKKDAFSNLTMPQAVIRLKQGFGRLIRTQEDRGVVVILDNRVLDKSYGRKFLNSLPLKTHVRGDSELILRKIRDWLADRGPGITLRLVQGREGVREALEQS